MGDSEKMLVIGAGPVGLAMARSLKKRGIPYEQLEADDNLGGNWYHGVYESAHIISSRKTTQYSDYPMPAHYPDFPSRAQMLEYFQAYAREFDLHDHIQFNTTVVYVRPIDQEGWEVTLEGGEMRRYKGVLVCSGHHWNRRWPSYPGTFTGTRIHSKDYKSPEQLRGKRVLTIGGGNSACDVASEAARVALSSHISLRRGYWFLPKTLFGIPSVELLFPWLPVPLQRLMMTTLLRIVVGPYTRYGLPQPDHRLFEHHPTINSELLHYIKHGRIQPHPDVRRFDGDTVEFVDGSRETFDLVVCATGFHLSFPFLAEGLVKVEGSIAKVYGGGMVPGYKHLYIVGTSQPRYGLGPLVAPLAELLAELILLQDRLTHPIGRLLEAMGQKPPTTHLVDPHQALRQLRLARRLLPWTLPRWDRRLSRRQASDPQRPLLPSLPASPTQSLPPPAALPGDLQVF